MNKDVMSDFNNMEEQNINEDKYELICQYSQDYNKRSQWCKIKSFITLSLMLLLVYIGVSSDKRIIATTLCSIGVLLLIYLIKINHDFAKFVNIGEGIVVRDGLITFRAGSNAPKSNMEMLYVQYFIKEITNVVTTKDSIIIYGDILVYISSYGGRETKRKKVRIPKDITNSEKFIEYAKSKISKGNNLVKEEKQIDGSRSSHVD